jgi:hypothetical protein
LAFDWSVAARLKRTMSLTSWPINPWSRIWNLLAKTSIRGSAYTAHLGRLLEGASLSIHDRVQGALLPAAAVIARLVRESTTMARSNDLGVLFYPRHDLRERYR